jgi:hypothetical protein
MRSDQGAEGHAMTGTTVPSMPVAGAANNIDAYKVKKHALGRSAPEKMWMGATPVLAATWQKRKS